MSKADIVGVHHDTLRELLLKLTGPVRAYYHGRYTDNDEQTLLAALAHLPSEFGANPAKYEGANFGPAFTNSDRPFCCILKHIITNISIISRTFKYIF
jgi:hypothetical protein